MIKSIQPGCETAGLPTLSLFTVTQRSVSMLFVIKSIQYLAFVRLVTTSRITLSLSNGVLQMTILRIPFLLFDSYPKILYCGQFNGSCVDIEIFLKMCSILTMPLCRMGNGALLHSGYRDGQGCFQINLHFAQQRKAKRFVIAKIILRYTLRTIGKSIW